MMEIPIGTKIMDIFKWFHINDSRDTSEEEDKLYDAVNNELSKIENLMAEIRSSKHKLDVVTNLLNERRSRLTKDLSEL